MSVKFKPVTLVKGDVKRTAYNAVSYHQLLTEGFKAEKQPKVQERSSKASGSQGKSNS